VNNTGATTFGSGRIFQTPTIALVNNEGNLSWHRTHEVKLYASYQIPVIEVGLNALVRAHSGRPFAPFQRFGSGTINFTASSLGREVWLEPRGSRTMPSQTLVDLRFDKYFNFGSGRDKLSLYVDVQNILNKGEATNIQNRVPGVFITGFDDQIDFGAPSAILPARQVILGARYSF
jgi:hypothetical protein